MVVGPAPPCGHFPKRTNRAWLVPELRRSSWKWGFSIYWEGARDSLNPKPVFEPRFLPGSSPSCLTWEPFSKSCHPAQASEGHQAGCVIVGRSVLVGQRLLPEEGDGAQEERGQISQPTRLRPKWEDGTPGITGREGKRRHPLSRNSGHV